MFVVLKIHMQNILKKSKQNEHAKNGNIQMTPIYLKYDKIFSKHIVTHEVANDCMPQLL